MKQFLIVGSISAITYADVFPYLKSRVVKYRPNRIHKFENGAAAATWYTTLIPPYIPPLELTKTYNPEAYPKYDNYDAINVNHTRDIPYDYDGVMGVPITFFDKYNPNQFEIIGMGEDNGTGYSGGVWLGGSKSCLVNGKAAFKRIFIKRK